MNTEENKTTIPTEENRMNAKALKRKALSPFENYIANVLWTFLGLSFFFMIVIAILIYDITIYSLERFVIGSWEEFIEIWVQASYGAAVVTFILITFFKYKEKRIDQQETTNKKLKQHRTNKNE